MKSLGGLISRFLGFLSGKTAENPRTTAWLTVLGSLGAAVGLRPDILAGLGAMSISFGTFLQSIAGAIGG